MIYVPQTALNISKFWHSRINYIRGTRWELTSSRRQSESIANKPRATLRRWGYHKRTSLSNVDLATYNLKYINVILVILISCMMGGSEALILSAYVFFYFGQILLQNFELQNLNEIFIFCPKFAPLFFFNISLFFSRKELNVSRKNPHLLKQRF
jgi:hypothetical protein